MKELVDITVRKHAETDKAVLVSDDDDEDHAKWIPKSQCEIEPIRGKPGYVIMTPPSWLAEDKGFA